MLLVTMNQLQFEYDIHSLVKSFYPKTDVKMILIEEREAFLEKNKESVEEQYPLIQIEIEKEGIQLEVTYKQPEEGGSFGAGKIADQVTIDETDKRIDIKNKLKHLIYKALFLHTGQTLPWGTLTGIRPTKIPMNLLEEGMEEKAIFDKMKETYLISDEKGQLSIDIAKREKELLSKIHYKEGYSLYIGIPFCPTTCLYCSFTSYPICSYKKTIDEYLTAVEKEIDFIKEAYRDKILDTVYVGGGTPTTLEAEELDRLLKKIKTSFDFAQVIEFTVEAGRADSITLEKLKVLKKHGITRISVNPQTMKEETLKIIGRNHTVEDVIRAFHMAREVGFTNINMDLILGLPGETKEDVIRTIEAVKQLRPDSLTVHSLAVKRASRLHQWITENGVETLNNTTETMEIASAGAKEMGMVPYYLYRQKNMSGNFENVGYATAGNFGVYNILMMEEKQTIVAIGAGSVSKVVLSDNRIERCDCIKDVGLYIEKIDEMIERKKKLLRLEGNEEI